MNLNVRSQSMYDPLAVQPMRDELNRVGVRDLRTPEDVDQAVKQKGTTLLVINSVCGCAAGGARPAVMLALQNKQIPNHLTAVFAGMERDAVDRARSYFKGYQPSSPCIALLKDGEVATMVQRHDIEGQSPEQIAKVLVEAFDKHCTRQGPSISKEEFAKIVPVHACGSSIPRRSP